MSNDQSCWAARRKRITRRTLVDVEGFGRCTWPEFVARNLLTDQDDRGWVKAIAETLLKLGTAHIDTGNGTVARVRLIQRRHRYNGPVRRVRRSESR